MSKVLVIDDEASLRFILAAALRRSGIEAWEASSAEEAGKLLAQETFDAIALDRHLHGSTMTGDQFLAWFRTTSNVPVLLITAVVPNEWPSPSNTYQSVLEKPFRLRVFVDAVRALL